MVITLLLVNIFLVVDQMFADISAISLKYIEKAFSGKPTYDVLKTLHKHFSSRMIKKPYIVSVNSDTVIVMKF